MDIFESGRFTKIQPIEKGWSGDKKYCATDASGTKYLLRISPQSKYDRWRKQFEILNLVASLGVPISQPIELGLCEDGTYTLHSWIDGFDLSDILPSLPEARQYELGLQSGIILKKIHTVPAPEEIGDWATHYNSKLDKRIQAYLACDIKFEGDSHVIDFINQNRHLLADRPRCFQHGDYHDGNMMLHQNNLVIIDFERYDFDDSWHEFNRIAFSAKTSPVFASGQLHGYFDGKPPKEFFCLLAFYLAENMLSSLPWAIPFGQAEIDYMLKRNRDILAWYDNMKNPMPTWYCSHIRA